MLIRWNPLGGRCVFFIFRLQFCLLTWLSTWCFHSSSCRKSSKRRCLSRLPLGSFCLGILTLLAGVLWGATRWFAVNDAIFWNHLACQLLVYPTNFPIFRAATWCFVVCDTIVRTGFSSLWFGILGVYSPVGWNCYLQVCNLWEIISTQEIVVMITLVVIYLSVCSFVACVGRIFSFVDLGATFFASPLSCPFTYVLHFQRT